jgi:hypothetical protein
MFDGEGGAHLRAEKKTAAMVVRVEDTRRQRWCDVEREREGGREGVCEVAGSGVSSFV